ncbi:aminoglycoside phosphotransferase family protein [Streptomyces johnsoniae]|uniref:Aminoglycoside phosphotransferase family protein n=1 Tax=Streptomyces johnsoniae TaxID=3075532 RepID=A0ABU2RZ73_9ACTN|nr:aminoglycoside phosphotransferase family protein [Streptomyces sp. DSM 41886]MDT0441937.1 aminoglycoside phosphotransferase family protein [Streptomyces sp. DSM 41886]
MITVPDGLAGYHAKSNGDAGRAWTAALPGLAARMLDHWRLRPTGPARHGMLALVLPVERADGSPAALKIRPRTPENAGEAPALRAWDGNGAVRLLAHDEDTGSLLLEALDPARSLNEVPGSRTACRLLTGLLGRLTAVPPPPGTRHLRDIAGAMAAEAPAALPRLTRDDDRRLLADCAAATRELLDEPGGALLHWDLHYENVLAPRPDADRGEPWLAIDPEPLVGDVGFDLLPALDNRFDPDEILPRFDLMTEALSLDRDRAKGWTLARVLQNGLWSIEDGDPTLPPDQTTIATTLLTHR